MAFVLVVPFVPFLVADASRSCSPTCTTRAWASSGRLPTCCTRRYLFGVLLYMLLATRFIRQREARAAKRLSPLLDDPVALGRAFRPAHWLAPPVIWRRPCSACALRAISMASADWTAGRSCPSSRTWPSSSGGSWSRTCSSGRTAPEWAWGWSAGCRSISSRITATDCWGPGHSASCPCHSRRPSYIGLALAGLWVATGNRSESLLVFTVVVAVGGVFLFFLPLHAVHVQMRRHKTGLTQARATRYEELFLETSQRRTAGGEPTTLDDLRDVVSYEVVERRIAAVRTWPFDTQYVVRLVSSFVVPILLADH